MRKIHDHQYNLTREVLTIQLKLNGSSKLSTIIFIIWPDLYTWTSCVINYITKSQFFKKIKLI